DLVDSAVGGGVDLDQVEGRTCRDLDAGVAFVAGLRHVGAAAQAVDRLGQQARAGRLASAAGAAEEVSVGHPVGGDGALPAARDGLLTDQVGEGLRAVLAVEGLVAA